MTDARIQTTDVWRNLWGIIPIPFFVIGLIEFFAGMFCIWVVLHGEGNLGTVFFAIALPPSGALAIFRTDWYEYIEDLITKLILIAIIPVIILIIIFVVWHAITGGV